MVQAVQQVRQDAMKEGRHQQAISRSQEVALTDHIKKPGIAQEKVLKDRKKICRKEINCKNQKERNVKRENIFFNPNHFTNHSYWKAQEQEPDMFLDRS